MRSAIKRTGAHAIKQALAGDAKCRFLHFRLGSIDLKKAQQFNLGSFTLAQSTASIAFCNSELNFFTAFFSARACRQLFIPATVGLRSFLFMAIASLRISWMHVCAPIAIFDQVL